MNFTEAANAVIEKVKRPDKISLARLEINAALMLFSSQMDSPRDLVEGIYTSGVPADYAHTVPLLTFPRFRKMDWLRYTGTRNYICPLDSRLLGSTCDVRDKYYLAGDSFKINLARSVDNLEYSYYAWPATLTDAAPNHWQLEGNWPAIVAKAASKVFIDIGDAESAARAEREAAVHFLSFQGDIIRGS